MHSPECLNTAIRAIVQVIHREIDNDAEDFMLSAYDASCSLERGKEEMTFTAR